MTSCKGEWGYSAMSDELRGGRLEDEVMVERKMVDVIVSVQ